MEPKCCQVLLFTASQIHGQAASRWAFSDLCAHIPYSQSEIMLQQSSHSCVEHNLLNSISEKDVGLGV